MWVHWVREPIKVKTGMRKNCRVAWGSDPAGGLRPLAKELALAPGAQDRELWQLHCLARWPHCHLHNGGFLFYSERYEARGICPFFHEPAWIDKDRSID
jgi:hypothetical protein